MVIRRLNSLFLSILSACCCVAWVGVWIRVVSEMNVVSRPWLNWGCVACLGLISLLPFVILRLCLSFAATLASVWLQIVSIPPSHHGLLSTYHAMLDAFRIVLSQHPAPPILSIVVFAVLFPTLYGLIQYSLQFRGLWLFYQALTVGSVIWIGNLFHTSTTVSVSATLFLTIVGLWIETVRGLGREYRQPNVIPLFLTITAVSATALLLSVTLVKPSFSWRPWTIRFGALPLSGTKTMTTLGQEPSRFNRIGFQAGPIVLGGSVVTNHLPVLSVISPVQTRLRGQVLHTYTGHVWTGQGRLVPWGTSIASDELHSTSVQHGPTTKVTSRIQVLGGGLRTRVLFGGDAIAAITGEHPLFVVPADGTWFALHNLPFGATYTVTSRMLQAPLAYLRAHAEPWTPSLMRALQTENPADLEVPGEFPQRDRQLASTITASADTELGKVIQIERYLEQHETYTTEGIPVPGKTEDYVDEFLFDTHRGYCNNFSTAFALLARSVGIPTRWVTGFKPGVEDMAYDGPLKRFIVRDSDAHSWDEVKFPNVGWVAFDPTPSASPVAITPSSSNPGTGNPHPVPGGASGGGASSVQSKTPPSASPSRSHLASRAHATRAFGFHLWTDGALIVLLAVGAGAGVALYRRARRSKRRVRPKRLVRLSVNRGGEDSVDMSFESGNDDLQDVDRSVRAFIQSIMADGYYPHGVTVREAVSHSHLMSCEKDEFVALVEKLWYSAAPLTSSEKSRIREIVDKLEDNQS